MMGVVNLRDINRYYEIYQEMKGLTPDDTLQLMLHAKSKDEQDFFAMVGDFFLQRRQRELIEKKAFFLLIRMYLISAGMAYDYFQVLSFRLQAVPS